MNARLPETSSIPERIALLRQSFKLMAPGAPFVQFTYMPASPVPLAAGGFTAQSSRTIWMNLPPARVFVYREAA